MTAQQIAYAKHREERRHNIATERLGRKQAAIAKQQADASTSQASTAAARQGEDSRHNYEQELINWFATRNLASLQQAQGQALLRQAGAAERQAGASESQARTAALNAQTRVSELGETIAHNRNVENETRRYNLERIEQDRYATQVQSAYNVARASEAMRHNVETEDQGRVGLNIQGIQASAAQEQASAASKRADAAMIGSVAQGFNAGANVLGTLNQNRNRTMTTMSQIGRTLMQLIK